MKKTHIPKCCSTGGDETRSGYVQYGQGIQPNVPAHTTFIEMHIPRSVHVP